MKVLLTGASGFLGTALIRAENENVDWILYKLRIESDLLEIKWSEITSVVHLAGIAHRMEPTPDSLYYSVNRDLTISLAREAKKHQVTHFIFISTIKVFGEQENHLTLNLNPSPSDAYGRSKWEAEQGLRALEDENFRVSIIRPPLIIGSGAKGNLSALMKLSQKPFPLPFNNITNQRAMISTSNLCAFIHHLINKPIAGTFLVAEDRQLSTTELIENIRLAMGSKTRLFAIPQLLRSLIKIIKPELYLRLFGSLIVDKEESYRKVGFNNPQRLEESIKEMVEHFQKENV